MSTPIRRLVTGHDPDGRAVIRIDEQLAPVPIASGDAAFALLWTSAVLPADGNDDSDGREREAGLTLHGGSVFRIVDMLPGGSSPMHRSNSLDYGIVLSGAVDLELDDGVIASLAPGDVVIQRGTIHAWHNRSPDTSARIAFVLTEALPRRVDGEPLPQVHAGRG